MSARDVEQLEADEAGKDTRDGSQPAVGGVHPATVRLSDKALEQIRMAGLVRPRAPQPGQQWQPRTEAERYLLREACRLDRVRQVLLGEVGKLRHELAVRAARRERLAAAARTADRLSNCPLSAAQLTVLAAAAAGESMEETSRRLLTPYDTIRSRRLRTVSLLGAHSFTQAVAMAVDAGWITSEEISGGVTP